MNKFILIPLLSIFFMSIGSTAYADAVVFIEDLKAAKEQAAQEGKLILIDFMASWCTPCKMMEEYTFGNPQVADYIRRNYVAVKVNIDDFDGFDLKQQYGVRLLPTLLFMDSKGRLLEKREESMAPSKMIERLEVHNVPKNKVSINGPIAYHQPIVPSPKVDLGITEGSEHRVPLVGASGKPMNKPMVYNATVKPSVAMVKPNKEALGINGLPTGTQAHKSSIPKEGFTVQVGSFNSELSLSDSIDKIRKGFNYKIYAFVGHDTRGMASYKLLMGNFGSRQQAVALSKSLNGKGARGAYVRDFASLR